MRWPWMRRCRKRDAALEALHRAQRDERKVEEVVGKAAQLKARNGFGEAIQRAMGGTPR